MKSSQQCQHRLSILVQAGERELIESQLDTLPERVVQNSLAWRSRALSQSRKAACDVNPVAFSLEIQSNIVAVVEVDDAIDDRHFWWLGQIVTASCCQEPVTYELSRWLHQLVRLGYIIHGDNLGLLLNIDPFPRGIIQIAWQLRGLIPISHDLPQQCVIDICKASDLVWYHCLVGDDKVTNTLCEIEPSDLSLEGNEVVVTVFPNLKAFGWNDTHTVDKVWIDLQPDQPCCCEREKTAKEHEMDSSHQLIMICIIIGHSAIYIG